MIPDYIYILCIYCHSKILQISKELEGIVCDCGNHIKNPYYKEENI
jgi:DNA-directed RNA polymerase subunit RPC12/RpoP